MSQLTQTRDHLRLNRRLVIGRSLSAAAAGALPVPVLEEWLTSSVLRGMVKKIADANSVDLSDEAVRRIADGDVKPPQWSEMVGGALLGRATTRALRRVFFVVLAARRGQAAARYFLLGTLFDHYCARLHVGLGLSGEDAAELRRLMDRAIDDTPGGLARRMVRRGLVAAARATVRAPLELADFASRGAVRRLLSRGDEVTAVEELDGALERQLRDQDGLLARAVSGVELQLTAEANPYINRLVDAFEALWREHRDRAREA
jgi:uncharacterized protein (DUF697 family)